MNEGFLNAMALAREGLPVFPSSRIFGPGAEDIATCDPAMLDSMNFIDPKAVWMVKCGAEFGLLALDTPRARDLEHLVADFGHFPPTLAVTRQNGGTVRWFACDPDADIELGVRLANTHAKFRISAVVPGSEHPKSRERYEILGGGALDPGCMERLPQAWIEALPKNRKGITANVVKRHEFTPQFSDY